MFYDLPTHIQNIIAKHLNHEDFTTAKKIYDDYHKQLTIDQSSPLHHNNLCQ